MGVLAGLGRALIWGGRKGGKKVSSAGKPIFIEAKIV